MTIMWFASYLHSSFRAKPRNMSVQGCGNEFLANLSLVIVFRKFRTHTPVQSYLSTSLRGGRDDGWKSSDYCSSFLA
jgi:hypothetical protein